MTPSDFLARLSGALLWRVRRLTGDDLVDRAIVRIAPHWRRFLKKPVFIGVTGSVGKTTTKELLLGMLGHSGRGVGTIGSLNNLDATAQAMMRLRPSDTFFAAELSEDKPGVMDEQVALLQPSVGIVTIVGFDHWSAYESREAIAAEMGKLIAALPANGTAVLNADDELVLAMAAKSVAGVITYGLSAKAELRAEDISSAWPERLQMTLVRGSERVSLRTQLCGTHWVPSVLGAIGGGLATGLSLEACAAGIASVAPFVGRMQPVDTPEGVTFIRDDYKAPLWTAETCYEFLTSARARRKIIVIGSLSDCGAGAPEKYVKVAKRAQDIVDLTIFVGPWASQVLKARKPGAEDALRVFRNVRDAAEYLNSITCEGDLVVLKGTNKQDHLLRLILSRSGDVACWRDDCERMAFCNECSDLNKPSGLPVLLASASLAGTKPQATPSGPRPVEPGDQVIIGLGNPESRFAGTPHNVGFEVVDKLATSSGLTWDETPEAWIARGTSQERRLCLVKIRMAMNLIGGVLKQLAETMAFEPEQCILVYDDLDMPLGSVRTRLSGGAGGHRGVTSILEAFQTDAFRRVKIGIDQEGAKLNRVDYVLTPFAPASRDKVDQAISSAEAHVLKLASARLKGS
jgi:UDP-N-acetylmuramoyl-tripeptide--D-alanyl-D-alanine ligase